MRICTLAAPNYLFQTLTMNLRIYSLSFLLSICFIANAQHAEVRSAKHFRVTPPLKDMEVVIPGTRDRSWKHNVIENKTLDEARRAGTPMLPFHPDKVTQTHQGKTATRGVLASFNGVGNVNGVLPPDTQGDVGPNHYMQMVNLSFAIWDKSGNLLYGPVDNSTLWNGFIGPWTGTNDGDPIVLYDEAADRWMASQFAVNTSNNTYWELIAISKTGDPLGQWYQYAYEFPVFNDYPKAAVWPDGYYFTFNMFGWDYNRVAACALERTAMLNGDPNARMILFDLPQNTGPWSMLPSDLDGTPPAPGTPCYFAYFTDDSWGGTDAIRFWTFKADWNNPAASEFEHAFDLPTEPFESYFCSTPRGACIPQSGTGQQLESMADRLMFRLQYRNFGSYESMVTNHTINVDGLGHAGVRWYEFRKPGGSTEWSIYQQGTYAPDTLHRWMGSIAQNAAGTIALGYTVSGPGKHPSMRYTGRPIDAPLGQLTFEEAEIVSGVYSQDGYSRWGDYSMMSVDPSHDSVFWFTSEYLKTGWKTHIASFNFAPIGAVTANAGPDGEICSNGMFFANQATAQNYRTVEWTTDGDGTFQNWYDLNTRYKPGTLDKNRGYFNLNLRAFSMVNTDVANDSVYVTIESAPVVQAGADTTILSDSYALLHGQVSFSDSVIWTTSGDGVFQDSTATHTVYFPGPTDISKKYARLKLTAHPLSPCTMPRNDEIKINITTVIGVNEAESNSRLSVFPNPANSHIKIRIPSGKKGKATLEIFDTSGSMLFTQSLELNETSTEKEINVNYLPQGLYFIRLKGTFEAAARFSIVK